MRKREREASWHLKDPRQMLMSKLKGRNLSSSASYLNSWKNFVRRQHQSSIRTSFLTPWLTLKTLRTHTKLEYGSKASSPYKIKNLSNWLTNSQSSSLTPTFWRHSQFRQPKNRTGMFLGALKALFLSHLSGSRQWRKEVKAKRPDSGSPQSLWNQYWFQD